MSGTYPTSPATLTEHPFARSIAKQTNVLSIATATTTAVPTTGQIWPRGAGES